MAINLGKGTVGIHGGYSPNQVNQEFYQFIKVQLINNDDPDTLEALLL